jgi:hypothetical protein
MSDDWNVINLPRVYKNESFLAVKSTLLYFAWKSVNTSSVIINLFIGSVQKKRVI